MFRSVRRIALSSARPRLYTSWTRWTTVRLLWSSSIVSFHMETDSTSLASLRREDADFREDGHVRARVASLPGARKPAGEAAEFGRRLSSDFDRPSECGRPPRAFAARA